MPSTAPASLRVSAAAVERRKSESPDRRPLHPTPLDDLMLGTIQVIQQISLFCLSRRKPGSTSAVVTGFRR